MNMARSFGAPYYTEDEECVMVWSNDETVTWNADGSVTLADGRVVRKRYTKPRRRANVDHKSEALGMTFDSEDERNNQLAEDRAMCGKNAPDFYDKDDCPHWRGDPISARRRQRRYCQSLGFAWRE